MSRQPGVVCEDKFLLYKLHPGEDFDFFPLLTPLIETMKEWDAPSFKSPLRCAKREVFSLRTSLLAGAAAAAPESVIRRFAHVGDGALNVPPSTEKLGRQPQKARSVRLHMQVIAFSLPSPAGKTGAATADPPCRECRLRPSPKGLGRAKRRGCGDCVLPSSAPGSGRPRSPAEMSFFGVYLSNQHNVGVDQRRGEVPSFAVSIRGIPKGGRNRNLPPLWRAFSFCPLSLCTGKEKMDRETPKSRSKEKTAYRARIRD